VDLSSHLDKVTIFEFDKPQDRQVFNSFPIRASPIPKNKSGESRKPAIIYAKAIEHSQTPPTFRNHLTSISAAFAKFLRIAYEGFSPVPVQHSIE
jgi:hypothetical protein